MSPLNTKTLICLIFGKRVEERRDETRRDKTGGEGGCEIRYGSVVVYDVYEEVPSSYPTTVLSVVLL